MKAKPSAMFGDVVYVFESTGRSFTPNDGIWGLTPDFQPRGGYDNTYYVTSNDPDDYQPEYSTLTHAECVELGEYMAAQWRAFADKHRGAAVDQADDKRLTPTEALRAGMVSVDDLAGIGKRIAGGVQPYHMAFDEARQRINELRNTGIGRLAVLHYKDGTKQLATWAHATSPQLVGKHAFFNTGEFDEHGAVIWKESGSK